MTMEKRVKVAELKAQLSAYIRTVRRGHAVTVCDRETPVARLVPYEGEREAISVRLPVRALRDIVLPPKPKHPIDVVAVVRELRQFER
jgi:prevent-host-death family protein